MKRHGRITGKGLATSCTVHIIWLHSVKRHGTAVFRLPAINVLGEALERTVQTQTFWKVSPRGFARSTLRGRCPSDYDSQCSHSGLLHPLDVALTLNQ